MARRRWVPEVTAGTIAIDGKNFSPIPLDLMKFMLSGSYDDRIAVLMSARARIARW
jgi:hypothetical protein